MKTLRGLLLALFFTSGFVALLYQVIWQRFLGLVSGVDLYSVTLVVAVFMLGMGLGSVAGGRLADRLQPSQLLVVFAVAELVVAACALASAPVYLGVFYKLAARTAASSPLLAVLATSTLLVPTFCMGVTLPVLSKAVVESPREASDRIAGLYGWNTLGAAAGAWVGSAYLVRSLGYEQSLKVGAGLNILCACAAALLAWRLKSRLAPASNRMSDIEQQPVASAHVQWPWAVWPAVYATSGFIALGLEMAWFRMLGVALKSTAYTFPLLLGFYLTGVACGSLVGRKIGSVLRRPLDWFLAAQAGIGLWAGLSVALLLWAVRNLEGFAVARRYLGSYEPIEFMFNFGDMGWPQLALYVLVPAWLILPPTFLMGVSFAWLQQGTQSNLARLGRRVGFLQAANIFGSTMGVLVVGVILIDRLGTPGTLRLLTLCSAGFLTLLASSVLAHRSRAMRTGAIAAGLVLAVAAAAAIPSGASFWAQFHAAPTNRFVHVEDATGLAVITARSERFDSAVVYVNGIGQSRLPFGGDHTFLGLVPALLHPAPRRVAIIGLGSGDTAYSAGGRLETESLECIDVIGGEVETLRWFARRTTDPGTTALLTDPRFRFIVGDGRRYVMQNPPTFDIIEADALRPSSAYSGNLYSLEYFQLLRQRLAPGGFAVTWAPTARIVRTFLSVFPHVVEISPMIVGSNDPIEFDAEVIRARAASAWTEAYYRHAGIDLRGNVDRFLTTFKRFAPLTAPHVHSINTDLFPRDELQAP
jgi:spermidine synthase